MAATLQVKVKYLRKGTKSTHDVEYVNVPIGKKTPTESEIMAYLHERKPDWREIVILEY